MKEEVVALQGEDGSESLETNAPDGETVQIVDNALKVLLELAKSDTSRGVRELSRDLSISKSSVQRILNSLRHAGMATLESGSKRYLTGPAVLGLAYRHHSQSDLVTRASRVVTELRHKTKETICVSCLVSGERITIYELESREPLRLVTGVGRPYSLYTGATGRVLLSLLDQETVEHMVAESAMSDRGRMDGEALLKRVEQAREDGFGISRGEWISGAVGVAVPIGLLNEVPAALSVVGPDVRLDENTVEDLIPVLSDAARQLSD